MRCPLFRKFFWGIKLRYWWSIGIVARNQRKRLSEQNEMAGFNQAVLPHLDAAYNLARWLTRNDQDAEDVAQEACLRALRFFPTFRGGDARAWLMKIVRNACYTWLRANRPLQEAAEFD